MEIYLGVDIGSVTTKLAALNKSGKLVAYNYLYTQGKPISMVQQGLKDIETKLPPGVQICGAGTTGSARYLGGVIIGADVIKNEITAHAIATLQHVPEARTILEIGGQDSKLITLQDGIVTDFAMNTVCAAGTGSFLEHQARRLGFPVEEFGELALKSRSPVRIAGRCTVFAESDMIHKQQLGHKIEDMVYGLCQALARNYLNNLATGKELLSPVVFQGGVAFNRGIVRAFEESLGTEIVVPPHNEVMGAIGAALVAQEEISLNGHKTKFKGFEISEANYKTSSFECKACSNHCEIAQISLNGKVIARWGGRCELWERVEE